MNRALSNRAAAGLTGVALVLVFVACGGGHRQRTPPVKRTGPVKSIQVYFCSNVLCPADATRRDERLVGAKLRGEPCVRQVRFVSKAQALAEMKKKFPQLFNQAMPANPLPDSFVVTPAKPSCGPELAAAVRAAHWPGVQHVGLKRSRPRRAS